jgi:hypothetical protein
MTYDTYHYTFLFIVADKCCQTECLKFRDMSNKIGTSIYKNFLLNAHVHVPFLCPRPCLIHMSTSNSHVTRWLSHHLSITIREYLVLTYRKCSFTKFSHMLFTLTVSINLNIKWKVQQKKLKSIRVSYTGLDLSIHAKKEPKNLLRHSI